MATQHDTPNSPRRVTFEVHDLEFESLLSTLVNHAHRIGTLGDARMSLLIGCARDLWRAGEFSAALRMVLDMLAQEVLHNVARPEVHDG